MTIFWQNGKKPEKPVKETNACNKCEPTLGNIVPDAPFDTERDALVAWQLFRKNLVETWGKRVWDKLWDDFKCTNNECKNKKACGNTPTYIEVGTKLSRKPPGGLAQFKLYLVLAREIQCVKETPAPKDVPPTFPDPTPKKKDGPPKKGPEEEKEPNEGPGPDEDEGMDDTPKMMFVTFEEPEFSLDDSVVVSLRKNGNAPRPKSR
jgi:hypothetical protein